MISNSKILADLQSLYDAIIARTTGGQVTQAGHKDKQTSFAATPLKDMIKLYRQLWFKESGLPDLQELDTSTARRGRPINVIFGDWR